MLTSKTRHKIHEDYAEVYPFLMQKNADIVKRIECLPDNEQVLMKFLYASMPVSDIADYEFDTYLGYARHAIFLMANVPWLLTVPDDIFLNYVLFYRINNEDITDCRELFFNALHDRVKGMVMKSAALEVNYWCAENVTYRSTDVRTASPLTVWRTGSGRCGEESTFTVTALRSVGIPARQVYVPRWSHCDDNHAWVEVWYEGQWHYMGACEPEPVPDRGWFTQPAKRAMFIHSRIFSSFTGKEEVIGRDGKAVVLNLTKNYAATCEFCIRVSDESGSPVAGAVIQYEVLNQSELFPVAVKTTDDNGEAAITLGLSDIHISVRKGKLTAKRFVNTRLANRLDIELSNEKDCENGESNFKITVPEADSNCNAAPTAEQIEQNKVKVALADKIREEKVNGFYREQEADEALKAYENKDMQKVLKQILIKARGNFGEVLSFLKSSVAIQNLGLSVKLLQCLSEKDYCDLKSEILLEHLNKALCCKEQFEEDIFVKYVLCPRIHFEKITAYRGFISEYFDEKTKAGFRNDPSLVWNYVLNKIDCREDLEYAGLFTTPVASLKAGCCSDMSKSILFVAVCRTIGIPARLNPLTLCPEYYLDGRFVQVVKKLQNTAVLVIHSLDNTKWTYMQNWTLGIKIDGTFTTIDLSEFAWQDGKLDVELPAGCFRLLVSNRMPDGSLYAREYKFNTKSIKTTEISIELPEAQISDLLENMQFPDFRLWDQYGTAFTAKEVISDINTTVIWMEVGKEPTEHILNELYEHNHEFIASGRSFVFILKNKDDLQNGTLQKVLQTDMKISVYYGDFGEDAPAVAKSIRQEQDKYPLVMVVQRGSHAVYSFCGYNVGMADLLIKITGAIS